MNWQEEVAAYQNTEAYHKALWERFVVCVNETPYLKEHRDFIDQHILGLGDRAFHWLWKLLVDEMPSDFKFLEIGVLMGQVVSLMPWIARHQGKHCFSMGITPLSSFAGPNTKPHWDNDYRAKIAFLCKQFDVAVYERKKDHLEELAPQKDVGRLAVVHLTPHDSTSSEAIADARNFTPFDIVYIDGCHEYDYVVKDIHNYGPMVKPGGFLVMDDSSNFLKMWWGAFPGIVSVSEAVRDTIEKDPQWRHCLACMHLRVWQRIT